jgi:hypothetical protein
MSTTRSGLRAYQPPPDLVAATVAARAHRTRHPAPGQGSTHRDRNRIACIQDQCRHRRHRQASSELIHRARAECQLLLSFIYVQKRGDEPTLYLYCLLAVWPPVCKLFTVLIKLTHGGSYERTVQARLKFI